jgi:hypothetical protein
MLNPSTATIDTMAGAEPTVIPPAWGEDTSAGLFTAPTDVSLLEDLDVDELGRRRSRWLPTDVLL